MTPVELKAIRAAIWEAMTARAEAVHDAVVLSHRRGAGAAGKRIHSLASELATLAQAVVLLAREQPEERR